MGDIILILEILGLDCFLEAGQPLNVDLCLGSFPPEFVLLNQLRPIGCQPGL